jgi:hypothetical protein
MSHFDEASHAREFARAFGDASDISGFVRAFRDAFDISGFAEGFWSALDWRGTRDSFISGYKEAARQPYALLHWVKGRMPLADNSMYIEPSFAAARHGFARLYWSMPSLPHHSTYMEAPSDTLSRITVTLTSFHECKATRTIFVIINCKAEYTHALAAELTRHPWVSEVWSLANRSGLLVKISVPDDAVQISQILTGLKSLPDVEQTSAMITSSVEVKG